MATWELAAKARTDFADMIEALTPEQLQQQSWCSEWKAEGVLAHVTSFVETGGFSFFGAIASSGFNFDKASQKMANKQLQRPTADVIASLRAKAAKSSAMPMFPEALTVADCAVHTQDVRRPLGLEGSLDDEIVRTALDFMTTHKMAAKTLEPRSTEGVKLVASDNDWSFGSGDEIHGTGEALMMALMRRDVLSELSGPGLGSWS